MMSDFEVKSLVEGLGGFAYGSPNLVLFGLFHEIPHSCLKYALGVIQ